MNTILLYTWLIYLKIVDAYVSITVWTYAWTLYENLVFGKIFNLLIHEDVRFVFWKQLTNTSPY